MGGFTKLAKIRCINLYFLLIINTVIVVNSIEENKFQSIYDHRPQERVDLQEIQLSYPELKTSKNPYSALIYN